MRMSQDSLGVLLLSYNHEHTITTTLTSVFAELPEHPLFLMDAGSSDLTVPTALEFAGSQGRQLRHASQPGTTIETLARGIESLGCRYCVILSSDDSLMGDYGAYASTWISSSRRGSALNWTLRMQDPSGAFVGYRKPLWTGMRRLDQKALAFRNLGTAPGSIIDTSALLDSGFFRDHPRGLIEDHLMWFYLLEYGRIDKSHRVGVRYRLEPASLSKRRDPIFMETMGFNYGFAAGAANVELLSRTVRRTSRMSHFDGYRKGYQNGVRAGRKRRERPRSPNEPRSDSASFD